VTDYLDFNRAAWDDRAAAHAASPDYAVERFVADREFLSEVVRFDLPLLGDVRGARGVHLQCHIGTDTISLARLGADMTGLDFSAASVAEARRISERAQTPVEFVESTVYDALAVLQPERYDLVFTGIGALCWLPDVRRWAGVVAGLLRAGGRLFIREGHPMLWAIDESRTDALVVGYPYFEEPDPIIDDEGGTYVATEVEFTHNISHSWNHGIGEIISALIDAGMQLTGFVEHDSVPWEALPGQMEKDAAGEWRLVDRPSRLALSYTLQATRSA
jgi:SAM-dependent methyltransferase